MGEVRAMLRKKFQLFSREGKSLSSRSRDLPAADLDVLTWHALRSVSSLLTAEKLQTSFS